ncbi:deoxyribodipyrimidine photo-lyase [Ferruginibacter sp. HRS2-29]|uniref:cryptochrome/photolyase family protein n=1 Tax=Ferruginibacter sp. HRS2-29 TaxID=2487334 RepID=UPI0020CFA665|nr:deoxyribodipyrimidine photo-lyase [Ferruginibacter sp. HRS2-29]MCP9750224.1 deoxyribodipyrimidine photo-lyase [Ferruginibacter sp. HRS2-29]
MKQKINIFWFRRDLRLTDNAGLYHALRSGKPVLPIFIFDTEILEKLEDRNDRRVNFIYETLDAMQTELVELGSTLHILHGTPEDCYATLLKKYSLGTVFTNHDYEPYATTRDKRIAALLKKEGVDFQTFKDQVILEKDEVLKDDGTPYTVFTPYSKKWKNTLTDFHLKAYPVKKYYKNFLQISPVKFPSLKSIGFEAGEKNYPPKTMHEELIKKYAQQRDFPGIHGTSHLGMHLRFGTISIRHLATRSQGLSETFLNELIWREFYHMILWHFPQVGKGRSFKPAYDAIEWEKDNGEFGKWCNGQTGYPIVDAGMRELNETGFMHNRVRMITASFLCKHLLLDWRLGEAYFAAKLLDFDLAANNGGWQWASSSGCDAAPYFRIFNPTLQMKRFDPDFTYIKKWVPEFQEFDYPTPIVNHEFARKRCLERYARALKKEEQ